VPVCDTFKQKHKEMKMSYWLTKITLLTCKSKLVLCSFLQSSTVCPSLPVMVVMGKFRNYGLVRRNGRSEG